MKKVYAVVKRCNPHIPSSGWETIIIVFETSDQANAWISNNYPNMKYEFGKKEPNIILAVEEYSIGEQRMPV
jgi:hypothetical protein